MVCLFCAQKNKELQVTEFQSRCLEHTNYTEGSWLYQSQRWTQRSGNRGESQGNMGRVGELTEEENIKKVVHKGFIYAN